MKKHILFVLAIIIIIVGCNGERERPITVNKKQDLAKTAYYQIPEKKEAEDTKLEVEEPDVFHETSIRNVKKKLYHGNGYIVSGFVNLTSLIDGEKDCLGKVLRKEFKKHYLYIIEDCKGNQGELIAGK